MKPMSDLTPPFGPADVEILERDTPFQGFFRVDTLTLRHKQYNGGWGKPVRREVVLRPRASAVLPYDPRRGEILLVEQFRVGALEWRQSPWCLELIAGIADKDGITLGEMESIAAYMPSPGGTNERLQVFVGHADLADAGGIFGCPDEGEDIRAVTVPVAEIPSLLESGLVDNAASLIALQWLLLHRDRLDAAWESA